MTKTQQAIFALMKPGQWYAWHEIPRPPGHLFKFASIVAMARSGDLKTKKVTVKKTDIDGTPFSVQSDRYRRKP